MSGFTIKMIAMLTMLIDHVAAILIPSSHWFYLIGRSIGRLAFPMFCFLIVQGLLHTKNIKKYLLRLLIFAFISEIPFDFAFFNPTYNDEHLYHQNIYFTLFIGLLVIAIIHNFDKYCEKRLTEDKMTKEKLKIIKLVFNIGVVMLGSLSAYVLNTDYSYAGVLMIWAFYAFKDRHEILLYSLVLINGMYGFPQILGVLSLFIIKGYNGERGYTVNKFIFYGFYPIHLLVLYYIRSLVN